MASEIKKQIKGYEGLYDIYPDGRVYSHISSRFLSASKRTLKGKDWYQVYVFTSNGKKTSLNVHRLVAIHFIGDPDDLPRVNHIDGNNSNNEISNLEYCDKIIQHYKRRV